MTLPQGPWVGGRTTVVGHRGEPRLHPDNTLAGVMAGLRAVGAVEVDLRMTADGHLVLSHDPEIRGRAIAATAWEELASCDVGAGHRLCLLDEVTPLGGALDLEVKNLPGEDGFDPHGRLALAAASRARSSDIVTSFYWPDMDLIRSRAPTVATGLLVARGGRPDDALDHAVARGHSALFVHFELVTPALVRAAASTGRGVVAWTVNDAVVARELALCGVAAIISDCPSLLDSVIRELGR